MQCAARSFLSTCSNSLHSLSSDSLLSQVLYPRVPAFDQYLKGGGEEEGERRRKREEGERRRKREEGERRGGGEEGERRERRGEV